LSIFSIQALADRPCVLQISIKKLLNIYGYLGTLIKQYIKFVSLWQSDSETVESVQLTSSDCSLIRSSRMSDVSSRLANPAAATAEEPLITDRVLQFLNNTHLTMTQTPLYNINKLCFIKLPYTPYIFTQLAITVNSNQPTLFTPLYYDTVNFSQHYKIISH